jgi:putative copper export protein
MNSYTLALTLHLLAATVWTGGHVVLALVVLPRVLRERSSAELLKFEAGFERIGIPALLIQIASGLWLANHLLPGAGNWLDFSNPVARLILVKLGLLALTAGLAADARLRLVPQLTDQNLNAMAWHIVPVTLIAVAFVVVGAAFRTGWMF